MVWVCNCIRYVDVKYVMINYPHPQLRFIRSHMRGPGAWRRRRILIFPFCYHEHVHTCAVTWWSALSGSALSVSAEVGVGWGFRSGCGKLGVGLISCRADFAPASSPLHDHVCVNTNNDLYWIQFSSRFHPRPPASAPRMSERTLKILSDKRGTFTQLTLNILLLGFERLGSHVHIMLKGFCYWL